MSTVRLRGGVWAKLRAMSCDRGRGMLILIRSRDLPNVGLAEDMSILMGGQRVYLIIGGSCDEMVYTRELQIFFHVLGQNVRTSCVKACHSGSGYIAVACVEKHDRMPIFVKRGCDFAYPWVSPGEEDSISCWRGYT